MYFISVDLGTTNIKVCCYDTALNVLSCESGNVLYNRHGDFVEFDAPQYYGMVTDLISKSCAHAGLAKPYPVTQIIFTGQAESLVVLNKKMDPARKAISWLDMRSRSECEELKSVFPSDKCYPITGQPEIIPTWPITKILWLKHNEPDTFSDVFKYLLLKDYIIYRLTGQFVGEYSIYNFSHYFDIVHKVFWSEILDYVGVKPNQLPTLVEPRTVVGAIVQDGAARTGLALSTKVNVGALDHFCGMIGTGNIRDGLISESAGTVLSIATMVSKPDFKASRIPVHYGPFADKYVYLPVCESGGISLEWFKNSFMQGESYAAINEQASKKDIDPELLFLPYIAGTNAPEFNSNAKGVFFGISASHDKYDFALAVMEGVAHLLAKNIRFISQTQPVSERIISTGGGARSELWCQLKADITGKTVAIPEAEETCCLGAAIIGAVIEGAYPDFESAIARCVSIKKEFTPRHNSLLEHKQRLFEALYNSLEPYYQSN